MSTIKSAKKALLIDANALIHRAWHALPPLTSPDGRVVNAVYGFSMALMKVVEIEHPDYLAVCWDTPEPTYRHEANKEYKAQRVEQPDEFYAQMPLVKRVVDAYGGTNVEKPGYEADDILATLATKLAAQDVQVTLLTSDRDSWQLIDDRIHVMAFKKGVSETATIDRDALLEAMGLTPEQIADYKALRGDPSDNLKGVNGIGEKTATDLLKAYGTFEGVFAAAHDATSKLSPSVRQKLIVGEVDARATLPLVQLVRDAPLVQTIVDIERRAPNMDELRDLFTEFGFKTLLARLFGTKDEKKEKVPSEAKKMEKRSVAQQAKKLDVIRNPSAAGCKELVQQAKREGSVIIHPVQFAQPSLFTDTPALVCGLSDRTVLFTEAWLREKSVAACIGTLFEDESIVKNGHGLKNVWHSARERGWTLAGIGFDTEIASYLLSAGEAEHDLASLAAAHLQVFFAEADDRPLQEMDAIRALFPYLQKELEDGNLLSVLDRFETPLIPVLAAMEHEGVCIDRDYFRTLSDEFRAEKKRLETEMERLAGEPFNPGSTQQLARILFEVLNIPSKGIKRGKTGISTAASELEKLEGAHPIIEKIGEYREVAKLLSTYVDALPQLADEEGRVHTTYNQALTATGRLSSSNPNLQNIPIRTELGRKIRRGFVARRGFRLLSCDYSQIELRIIAALARDAKMSEAFQKGQDIHTATAAAIWDIPLDEVTKEQRRAAKAVNFGIIYGQGPVGLSKSAGISFDEAKRFIADYFRVYAGIREYLETTKALARSQGYVETLFGRRRVISDINSPLQQFRAAAERMAINMPVQGTAADLMKLAMIQVARELPRICEGASLLLQVHDEMVFEVPEKHVENVARAVQDLMENVEKIGVPILVEAKAGKNWDEMKKVVV